LYRRQARADALQATASTPVFKNASNNPATAASGDLRKIARMDGIRKSDNRRFIVCQDILSSYKHTRIYAGMFVLFWYVCMVRFSSLPTNFGQK
jgi:hypothetical protein